LNLLQPSGLAEIYVNINAMKFSRIAASLQQFLSVPRDNSELVCQQYRVFSAQMPIMYAILLVNSWALAYNFIGNAPDWLALYSPLAFSVLCVVRLVGWSRAIGHEPSAESAYRAMARSSWLAIFTSPLFAIWPLLLYPYGSPYEQAHVAFYMAITVIGVIFCLMHLRSSAIVVAIVVNFIFIGFFGLSQIPAFVAMAVNILLVSIAMLAILIVYYRDFTQMVAARTENFRLANIDPLTGLPNRRHFFDRLPMSLAACRATGAALTVGVLDLDGFKSVNDLYGHSVGDELLMTVGVRLKEICADRLYVARLGGDEFAIIAEDANKEEVLSLGNSICACLRAPFDLEEVVVEVTATVGFAFASSFASEDARELFEQADYALYQGKRASRGMVTFFSETHRDEIRKTAMIEKALRTADLNEELTVLFQPIIRMDTGEAVAFEALARWHSKSLGLVPPSAFIPVAERAGIIHRLTKILLAKALAVAVSWPPDIRLSFNLSARDIVSKTSVLWLTKILSDSGFDTNRIDFEITETSMLHDYEQALDTIAALKALGCGISLDDFGTGYSSLSQLHSLPLTKIKIDRSFVTDLHVNPASYKIVRSMVSLSRDMGLDCIIEGVETAEEVKALQALGCSYVQGYRYSRPLPADAALSFLRPGMPHESILPIPSSNRQSFGDVLSQPPQTFE